MLKTRRLLCAVAVLAVSALVAACGVVEPRQRPSGAAAIAVIIDQGGRVVSRLAAPAPFASAASDGHGGWYVSKFASPQRVALARLSAMGRPETGFRARLSRPAPPDDLTPPALLATNRGLFVGGNFRRINRSRAAGLALLSGSSGQVRPGFRSRAHGADSIAALTAAAGTLVAGETASFANRRCLTAVSARSGKLIARFRPPTRQGPEVGCISALLASRGGLYVAGNFMPGEGLARLRVQDGTADPRFRPPRPDTSPCGGCHGLISGVALAAGRLIVGGQFRQLGSNGASGLAALDPGTGSLVTRWRGPRISGVLGVSSIGDVVAAWTEKSVVLFSARTGRKLLRRKVRHGVTAVVPSGDRFLVLFAERSNW